MKISFKTILLVSLILSAGRVTMAEPKIEAIILEKIPPSPYPKAENGHKRQVIFLPKLNNEDNAKVELMIGKTVLADCNRHVLIGKVETKTLEGWGYNYLVVSSDSQVISTRMACPEQAKKQTFVRINNIPLQRYNSKLPIVLYLPEDMQVKYRIWTAQETVSDAKDQQ